MRILVTGHRGHVGRRVAEHLAGLGHEVAGFDVAEGDDLLDREAVGKAAAGCRAVVHLGAIPHDTAGTPEQIMAVNVLGTWHVLLAAEAAGAERVVSFSSAQALGIAGGERMPDYFPVDDRHPRRAARPYGLSKRIGEDLCAAFTERTGVPTVCLRPFWVWDAGLYERVARERAAAPSSEWEPFWEYGAFVDVRDVAEAVERSLAPSVRGHLRALLCAPDSCASAPSLEMARRLAPEVPLRAPERYRREPRAALVDSSGAEEHLGWRPRHTFAAWQAAHS